MEATINFQLLRKAARVFDLPCLHSSVWLSTPSSTSSLIHPELILSLCRQRVRDMIMNELADECLMVYCWNVSGPTQRPTTHTHLMLMKHDPYNEVNQNSVDDLLQTPNLEIDWFLAKDPQQHLPSRMRSSDSNCLSVGLPVTDGYFPFSCSL